MYLRIARRRSGVAVVGRRGINWTDALLRLTGSAGEEAGSWNVEACSFTPPKLRKCADKAENMKLLIRCLAGL